MIKKNGTLITSSKSLNTKEINIFKSVNNIESLDIYVINICSTFNLEEIDKLVDNYNVEKDRDYVFYQVLDNVIKTWFKNKKGRFDFCGSGLLALAKNLCLNCEDSKINFITADGKEVLATNKNLDSKVKLILFVNDNVKEISNNLWLTETDVLIERKRSIGEISSLNINDVLNQPSRISKKSLGAYCCFFQEGKNIYLRYFTPWYGRDEDFVTLSIFEYLSSFIDNVIEYKILQNNHYYFYVKKNNQEIYLRE